MQQKDTGISATIITLNEEKKLKQCLDSLSWVNEIIVVDCGSTDKTLDLAQEYGAKIYKNDWPGYGQQKNFAMDKASHEWVLNIDADEVVSNELKQSIQIFIQNAPASTAGAAFPRKAWYLGQWILHGGWYPNYSTRLSRKNKSRWTEPAVHENLEMEGNIQELQGDLLHYTFDSVADQVRTNIRFAQLGAIAAQQRGEKSSLYKIILKPIGKFLETYLWKKGFLDGFPGFVISVNAAHSIFMKYVELYIGPNTNYR